MPEGLQADAVGPVDVAVIMFDGNSFNGDVVPALADLHDGGTVRVLDLAFVRKDADGSTAIVEVGDADVAEAFERVGPQFDLLNDEDLDEIADGLQPDCSAMVVVWENSWAARFAAAVRGSQGEVVRLERIPREAVLEAIAALDEDED